MPPQVGQQLILDGFVYVIVDNAGGKAGITKFVKPEGIQKGGYPCKLGYCVTDELVQVDQATVAAMADDQADALAGGKPAAREWAKAANAATKAKFAALTIDGAWALPRRVLPNLRGPGLTGALPATATDAALMAQRALHYPTEG